MIEQAAAEVLLQGYFEDDLLGALKFEYFGVDIGVGKVKILDMMKSLKLCELLLTSG